MEEKEKTERMPKKKNNTDDSKKVKTEVKSEEDCMNKQNYTEGKQSRERERAMND